MSEGNGESVIPKQSTLNKAIDARISLTTPADEVRRRLRRKTMIARGTSNIEPASDLARSGIYKTESKPAPELDDPSPLSSIDPNFRRADEEGRSLNNAPRFVTEGDLSSFDFPNSGSDVILGSAPDSDVETSNGGHENAHVFGDKTAGPVDQSEKKDETPSWKKRFADLGKSISELPSRFLEYFKGKPKEIKEPLYDGFESLEPDDIAGEFYKLIVGRFGLDPEKMNIPEYDYEEFGEEEDFNAKRGAKFTILDKDGKEWGVLYNVKVFNRKWWDINNWLSGYGDRRFDTREADYKTRMKMISFRLESDRPGSLSVFARHKMRIDEGYEDISKTQLESSAVVNFVPLKKSEASVGVVSKQNPEETYQISKQKIYDTSSSSWESNKATKFYSNGTRREGGAYRDFAMSGGYTNDFDYGDRQEATPESLSENQDKIRNTLRRAADMIPVGCTLVPYQKN